MIIRISIPLFALALSLISAHGQRIGLAEPISTTIGHVDVFAEKAQTIELSIHPPAGRVIRGRLFQRAGKTLAPVADVNIDAGKLTTVSVEIDFPQSETATDYVLIFDAPETKRLNITAHPSGLLDSLQQLARETPISLVDPPEGLSLALDRLGIASKVREASDSDLGEIVLVFQEHPTSPVEVDASRVIIVSPKESAREIWVKGKNDEWRICIPPSFFDPEKLTTAYHQSNLKRLLLSEPTCP